MLANETSRPEGLYPLNFYFEEVIHVSRSTGYSEINAGRLRTVKIKGRRFVSPRFHREYMELLEKEAS